MAILLCETDAPRALACDLDGAGDQLFSLVAPPTLTGGRVVLGPVIDRGFVDFDQAGQSVALGIGRCAPELSAQEPGYTYVRSVAIRRDMYANGCQRMSTDATNVMGHHPFG